MWVSALLLANGLIAAQPSSDAQRMPAKKMDSALSGRVAYSIIVDPSGQATKCEIVDTSGHREIDEASCEAAMRHLRFRPARTNGVATWGTFGQTWTWKDGRPTERPSAPAADLAVLVNRLPPPWTKIDLVDATVLVDEQGQPVACQPDVQQSFHPYQPGAPPDAKRPADPLISITCKQIITLWKTQPILDSGGRPVRSIRHLLVAFGVG